MHNEKRFKGAKTRLQLKNFDFGIIKSREKTNGRGNFFQRNNNLIFLRNG